MATMTIRDIADDDYAYLLAAARENNRSAAAQVREMIAELKQASDRKRARNLLSEIEQLHKLYPLQHPPGYDALALLREERESW
ncbi:MAG: hypothetical protein RL367_77 [Pseudomonadota bacterium]